MRLACKLVVTIRSHWGPPSAKSLGRRGGVGRAELCLGLGTEDESADYADSTDSISLHRSQILRDL